jgi:hypothetical protein
MLHPGRAAVIDQTAVKAFFGDVNTYEKLIVFHTFSLRSTKEVGRALKPLIDLKSLTFYLMLLNPNKGEAED